MTRGAPALAVRNPPAALAYHLLGAAGHLPEQFAAARLAADLFRLFEVFRVRGV